MTVLGKGAISASWLVVAALLVSGQCFAAHAGLTFAKSATADLNGDGRSEHVYLTVSRSTPDRAKLHVGALAVDVHAELPEGIAVVDLDRKDHFREVVLQRGNQYDGGHFHIVYGYDGKRIAEIGELDMDPQFKGNGIVYARSWTGSFSIQRKFVLQSRPRELREIRQPMYYIGKTFQAQSSFPIRQSIQDASVVANIEPKSRILIVAVAFQPEKRRIGSTGKYETIEHHWYLIKSQSGLMGWASDDTVVTHVPVPMAG